MNIFHNSSIGQYSFIYAIAYFFRVFEDAPRLSPDEHMPWKNDSKAKPRYDRGRDRRRSTPMYASYHRHSYDSRSTYHRKHKHGMSNIMVSFDLLRRKTPMFLINSLDLSLVVMRTKNQLAAGASRF